MHKIISLPLILISFVFSTVRGTFGIFIYIFLIWAYICLKVISALAKKIHFLKKSENAFTLFLIKIDGAPDDTISRIELIELAMANMKSKRSRTLVTVGGMAIGIGAIVFLVSIGFGVQSLVVSKVARFEERRQTEVIAAPKSNLVINDDMLSIFKNFPNVEMVLPQIAVVGKVSYKNSSTDMAVYGVTEQYLEQSAISPIIGKAFESNEINTTFEVITSKQLEDTTQSNTKDEILVGDWVEVTGESNSVDQYQISKVTLPAEIQDREAVVNKAFLKILNITDNEALGTTFSVAFLVSGKLFDQNQTRIESLPIDYKIIGVTPDDATPIFYVPFIHLKSLGINNYSQTKIIARSEESLRGVRDLVEAQGFISNSVVDTIADINNLFATARTFLALFGTIALFVASLGMFNTLTVSLLERTREIGLLKAMGMRSNEIRDSFLAESMLMASLGGVLGIGMGFISGKLLETILSLIAIRNGASWLHIIEIPFFFSMIILILSFLVGVLTGLYPAKRASTISALNALRYE
ncbi:MAG: ABC transporter permease [bacterium]